MLPIRKCVALRYTTTTIFGFGHFTLVLSAMLEGDGFLGRPRYFFLSLLL